MNRGFDLVLFDLDGTLLETAPEISDAVNDTLKHFKLPAVTQTQVERWIGHGTRELLIQAVASISQSDPEAVRNGPGFGQLTASFDGHYLQRCGTRSRPYAGAVETLDVLEAAGVKACIVTNKEAAYTQRLLDSHRLSDRFALVVSGDTLPTKKPNPAGVHHCLKTCGVAAHRTLFVGDSSIDVETARNAGLTVWAFTHGYNMGHSIADSRPDRVLGDFNSLKAGLVV